MLFNTSHQKQDVMLLKGSLPIRRFVTLVVLPVIVAACSSPALDDYRDTTFELTNQNGETVIFPDDYEGNPVVMGFIYTNCPDICSFITANVGKIYEEMERPGNTRFVLVTFDPERDTPDVLKSYARAFDMDKSPFHFLTGDPETIQAFMDRMGVRTQISHTEEGENNKSIYFINHSDKILLIDQNSRLIFDYGGSMTPPEMIAEDLEKL